jgi:hypothetical protein
MKLLVSYTFKRSISSLKRYFLDENLSKEVVLLLVHLYLLTYQVK